MMNVHSADANPILFSKLSSCTFLRLWLVAWVYWAILFTMPAAPRTLNVLF